MTDDRFARAVLPTVVAAALAATLTACYDAPAAPSAPVETELRLAPGESATVDGALQVRFHRVVSDSRCPVDVTCVWQGDAVVALSARLGSEAETAYELHTAEPARGQVVHGLFRIRLLRVEPDPLSTEPIPAARYRAVLLVSRG